MAKVPFTITNKLRFVNVVLGLAGHFVITLGLIVLLLIIWSRCDTKDITARSTKSDQASTLLRGLKLNLHQHDAAARMQEIFPEGACFTWTLYGLAWSNLYRQHAEWPPELEAEALEEIEAALAGQMSPATLAPFSDTQVRNGGFWLGQRNLLLARYLQLHGREEAESKHRDEFHKNSRELHSAILERKTHHLDSYEDMCWPADSIAAVASLVIHDELFGTNYRTAYEVWKKWTQANAWSDTQLPAGRIDGLSGQHIEPARGVANSWIIPLVAEVDPEWGRQMYEDYTKHFGIRRLGFRMFREYPPRHPAKADIDSGPIIWGAGVAATGVGLAAANSVGDVSTMQDIYDLSRMFGFPFRFGEDGRTCEWHYLGKVPVGDAFLAYGLSIPAKHLVAGGVSGRMARWPFHAILSLLFLTVIAQYVLFLRRGIRIAKRHMRHDGQRAG